MSDFVRALFLAIVVLIAGCSTDQAKRTAYETLQNVRQQECLKNPSLDCGKRESYEDYERKRKELEPLQ
ncbi:MAG: hypothetical protein ACOY9D_10645 [Pseudomonadota bacterium]